MEILINPRWPPYKEKHDSKLFAFMKGAYVFNFGSIGQKKAEIWQFQNLSEDTSPNVLGRIIPYVMKCAYCLVTPFNSLIS